MLHKGRCTKTSRRFLTCSCRLSTFHLFHYLFLCLLRGSKCKRRSPASTFSTDCLHFFMRRPISVFVFFLSFSFSFLFFTPAPTTSTCNYAKFPNPRRRFRDRREIKIRNLEGKKKAGSFSVFLPNFEILCHKRLFIFRLFCTEDLCQIETKYKYKKYSRQIN